MGKYEELIKEIDSVLNENAAGYSELLGALTAANEALKAENERFDVLKHLRNGGKITRPCWKAGDYCQLEKGQLTHSTNGAYETCWRLTDFTDWQPYEEPELEYGTWYWCINKEGHKFPGHHIKSVPITEEYLLRHLDGTPCRIEEPETFINSGVEKKCV